MRRVRPRYPQGVPRSNRALIPRDRLVVDSPLSQTNTRFGLDVRSSLGVSLLSSGYSAPTPFQTLACPSLLLSLQRCARLGADPRRLALRRECVFLRAPSGSGKSLGVLIPLLGHVLGYRHRRRGKRGVLAVVLVPDDEAALKMVQAVRGLADQLPAEQRKPQISMFQLLEHTERARERMINDTPDILVTTPTNFLTVYAINQSANAKLPFVPSPEADLNDYLQVPGHIFSDLHCIILDDSERIIPCPTKFESRQEGREERRFQFSKPGLSTVNALLQLGDPLLVFSSHALNSRLERHVVHLGWTPSRPQVITLPTIIPEIDTDLDLD
jgi:hypothetical protein